MNYNERLLSEVTANLVMRAGGKTLSKQKGFMETHPGSLVRLLKRIRIDSERAETLPKDRKTAPRGLYKEMVSLRDFELLYEAMEGDATLTKEQHAELFNRLTKKLQDPNRNSFEKQIYQNVLTAIKNKYPYYQNSINNTRSSIDEEP